MKNRRAVKLRLATDLVTAPNQASLYRVVLDLRFFENFLTLHISMRFAKNFTIQKSFVLKLWTNGFTVDSGALRAYAEPQNKKFLESVERG